MKLQAFRSAQSHIWLKYWFIRWMLICRTSLACQIYQAAQLLCGARDSTVWDLLAWLPIQMAVDHHLMMT
jgi:hypothetical protein